MKLKIFGFFLFLILCTWFYWNQPKPITINDSLVSEKAHSQKKQITPLASAKSIVPIKIPTHSSDELNPIEESIPWAELEKRWERELKDFITSIDPNAGEKRFKKYQEKKQSFIDQTNILMNQRNKTYSFNEQTNEIVFKDKKKYEELNLQIDSERKILAHHTRLIFGDFYPEVRKFHQEFEQSIQAYNNTEGRIGIAPAFAD